MDAGLHAVMICLTSLHGCECVCMWMCAVCAWVCDVALELGCAVLYDMHHCDPTMLDA